ncbi:hypothetical protein [Streptomyces sp. NPDC055749]
MTGFESPGQAVFKLAANVRPLDPESTVFRGMLEGWVQQQRSRFPQESGTIAPRLALIRRMADFTGQYPLQWTPAEAEAFIAHLRSGSKPIMVSTARGYEISIKMFCAYISDPRYSWAGKCE